MTTDPFAIAGQRIGLLGGSFDPPHAGHVHVTRAALTRFDLDRVWWLVTPANPLKPHGPAPLDTRITAARAIMQHPRVTVTGIEATLGTRYTAQTLVALRHRWPGVRFVWLMGADNLAQLHRWQEWRRIMQTVPVGVLARPGDRMRARTSVAARVYADARLPASRSRLLGLATAPAWCFINLPMVRDASSMIRARGDWQAGPRM